jgi:hypothetical protein
MKQTSELRYFPRILFLDDIRDPFIDIEGNLKNMPPARLFWVKNYDEFCKHIREYGVPSIVFFDHDLAPEHYTPEEYWNDYEKSKAYQESKSYKEKTGLDCAVFLVEYCKTFNIKFPFHWYVHSANPVGRDKIINYIKSNT